MPLFNFNDYTKVASAIASAIGYLSPNRGRPGADHIIKELEDALLVIRPNFKDGENFRW